MKSSHFVCFVDHIDTYIITGTAAELYLRLVII